MLYNDIINYNDPSTTYSGSVHIFVPGISSPIIIGSLVVAVLPFSEQDYSNATTIGVISYGLAPNGIFTIEATNDQAQAIANAEIIYIDSVSGETIVDGIQDQVQALIDLNADFNSGPTAQISIQNV